MNTQFAAAVHLLVFLHLERGKLAKSETLAHSIGTNPSVVRRLCMALTEAGLINSIVGRSGGTRLAKAAQDISLLDVYRAVALRPHLQMHAFPNHFCPVGMEIGHVLQRHVDRAQSDFEARLRQDSIADVAQEVGAERGTSGQPAIGANWGGAPQPSSQSAEENGASKSKSR